MAKACFIQVCCLVRLSVDVLVGWFSLGGAGRELDSGVLTDGVVGW